MGYLLRRDDPDAARRPARRRQEREAPGREPALRPSSADVYSRELPAGPPVPHTADRLDGRSRRGHARRRAANGSAATTAPTNAVLVLAGDIDVATARAKAEQYFGHIAPGPAVTRPGEWIAARTDSRRETMYDQVAQPRWQRYWNTPARQHTRLRVPRPRRRDPRRRQDLAPLRAARVPRPAGRQRRRGTVAARDRGSVHALGRRQAGRPVAKVEAAMMEELQRFIEHGPTAAELERAKIAIRAGFIRGLERIGGFGGKADVLASCEVLAGDPACYRQSLQWIDAARPADLQRVAREWLSHGDYTLESPAPAALCSGRDGRRRSHAGTAGHRVVSRHGFPRTAACEAQQWRAGNHCRASRRAGRPRLGAVRRRLRRRPGSQARHRELHDVAARRRGRPARFPGHRGPR